MVPKLTPQLVGGEQPQQRYITSKQPVSARGAAASHSPGSWTKQTSGCQGLYCWSLKFHGGLLTAERLPLAPIPSHAGLHFFTFGFFHPWCSVHSSTYSQVSVPCHRFFKHHPSWGCGTVAEHFPSMHKDLGSIPAPQKNTTLEAGIHFYCIS